MARDGRARLVSRVAEDRPSGPCGRPAAVATLPDGMGRATFVAAALVAAFVAAPPALAASWLPHPADATWTYEWSDSVYNTTPTKEKVTVKEQNANAFLLEWTTQRIWEPRGAPRRRA